MTAPGISQSAPLDYSLRIDKWLWHCRFFKSRSEAARFSASGKVRVNRRTIAKPSHPVKPGDVLTFIWRDEVAVVQVQALGTRRGPPAEARSLYEDLPCARQDDALQPLAPAAQPMLDAAYGQSDTGIIHAATG